MTGMISLIAPVMTLGSAETSPLVIACLIASCRAAHAGRLVISFWSAVSRPSTKPSRTLSMTSVVTAPRLRLICVVRSPMVIV